VPALQLQNLKACRLCSCESDRKEGS
jgi:hypothetical protein